MNEYLEQLGYSREEIEAYAQHWNESIQECLDKNQTNVIKNMELLKPFFEKDLLLVLPIFYSVSFILPHEKFKQGIDLLKTAFPDKWIEMIIKQFYGFDGYGIYIKQDTAAYLYEPYLQIMGTNSTEFVQKALMSLKEPAKRKYAFIDILKHESAFIISAEDINEDYLLDLEVAKYSVANNVNFLLSIGVEPRTIKSLFWYCPYVFELSQVELEEELVEKLGKNFVKKLNTSSEKLYELID